MSGTLSVASGTLSVASGTLNAAPPVGGYDPLSVAWEGVYWAEDPDWTPPADGGAIVLWRDAAGSRPLSVGAGTPRYDADGLGGRPCVYTTATTAYLSAAYSIAQPNTLVFVAAADGAATDFTDGVTGTRHLVDLLSGNFRMFAGTSLASSTPAGTTPHLIVAEFNGASSRLLIDGAVAASGNAGTNDLGALRPFFSSSGGSTGRIAFIGVHNGVLPSGDQDDLLAWSQGHYGTP